MGYYSGSITLNFEGTTCEKQMMEKLLQLMDREYGEEWTLPVDEDYDFFPATALLGPLEKLDDGRYSFGFPVCSYAPRLFAALFPSSKFQYSIITEYSVTMEDTPYLTVVYEDNKLMMRNSYLYSDRDDEKIADICRKQIETDPKAKEIYEQYLEDSGLEEDEVSWSFLFGELVDNPVEIMASFYEFRRAMPARDEEYEKSFFEEGDLQAYLVSEQIKNHDMTLAEYIKQFPFTEGQFQSFIQTAADCDFTEMTAFLLEEKQSRVVADEKGCDGSSILRPNIQECINGNNVEIDGQKRIEFEDKIFVLTGFNTKLEEEFSETIRARGGIIKSSTVLKTDYLIYDEKNGLDTVKHRRAIELNSKGKNIQIISGNDFLDLIRQ